MALTRCLPIILLLVAVLGSNGYLTFEIPPPPLTRGELIRTLCAVIMKGMLAGVLFTMVVVALIEAYAWMRMKIRNNRNAATAAPAVEDMSGVRMMK